MKVSEFERISGARCLTGPYEDREIACGYTCDLLSHVMGRGQADMAWITVQAHMNVIAAKAFCAEEALTPEFRNYIHKVCFNAREMAEEFIRIGYKVVTGGTDNHMFLLDLSRTHPHVTGKMAQDKLDEYLITVNKNMVPGDKRKPSETSGIRIGTAAMTTRGWMSRQFVDCARYIGITLDKLEEKARESNNSYNERS